MAGTTPDAKFNIVGCGIAELNVRNLNGAVNRVCFAAVHTPSFAMNLISIPELDDAGFKGEWGNGWLSVKHLSSNEVIMDSRLTQSRGSHQLYELDIVDDVPGVNQVGARSHNKPCSLEMWHCCFGHCDIKVIEWLAKREMIDGLIVTNFELCRKCKPCILMKMTRQPFDDEVKHSTEVLKCISLDLWGKARTQSRGGAWYMGLMVDQATGLPTPFFTSSKRAEVILDEFKTVLTRAEMQTGKKAKVGHIDKGREWDNALLITSMLIGPDVDQLAGQRQGTYFWLVAPLSGGHLN